MSYVHERAQAALDKLTRDASDTEIATCIAEYMLAGQRPPHSLTINHNGKVSPCPVRIDKAGAKKCFVTHYNTVEARTWMIDALLRGYEISTGTMRGHETQSVAQQRGAIDYRIRMQEWREKRAAGGSEIDDEIPF